MSTNIEFIYPYQVNLTLKADCRDLSRITDMAIYVHTTDADDAAVLAWHDLAEEIGYDDARNYEVVSVEDYPERDDA
jgi:hypothetical protein